MSIGNNIRTARQKKGYSQKMLSELLTEKGFPVGDTTISNWERGDSKPDLDILKPLCEILDIDANYILDFDARKRVFENKQQSDIEYKKILMDKGLMDKDGNIDEKNFEKIITIGLATKQIFDKEKD